MTPAPEDNELRLLAALERGSATSRELQRALGLSQPTVSRLLNALGGRVLRLGRGRTTRYAVPRQVRGLGYEFPVYRITQAGDVARLGDLFVFKGPEYWWQPAAEPGERFDHLPWFIQDLRPSGFMGRAFAHRNSERLGLPPRLQDWSDDHVLAALSTRGDDLMGDLLVGEESLGRYLESARHPPPAIAADHRAAAYPALVTAALAGDPPGSSAAGEQPKFAALVAEADGIRHVLVKFSPPTHSASGRRWADLLVCEHLALQTLRERGIPAAASQLLEAGGRYLLEVTRFDRQGRLGRLPLLSLLTIDAEFFGELDDWAAAATRLQRSAMLSPQDAEQLRWLATFASLIANTDPHFGNISLIPTHGKRRFALAPAYDMLPMLYAPRGEEVPDCAFKPPNPARTRARGQWEDALHWATAFWEKAAADPRISAEFRQLCATNAEQLNQEGGGPRLL